MSFNPDTLKPAQVVNFSWERTKPCHLDINFTGNPVKFTKKHLGKSLDSKLDFDEQIKQYLIKLVNLLVSFASSEIPFKTILSTNL